LPLECSQGCAACGQGCGVEVLLRPDDIVHDDRSELLAEVRHKAFRGAEILYTLKLASGVEVLSLVPSHHNHALGELIGIRLDVDHVVAFKTPMQSFVPIAQSIPFLDDSLARRQSPLSATGTGAARAQRPALCGWRPVAATPPQRLPAWHFPLVRERRTDPLVESGSAYGA
jgi:hypothetical protein